MPVSRRRMGGLLSAGLGAAALPRIAIGQGAGPGRHLRIAVQELPPQLDPLLLEYNSGYRILFNVYDSLLGLDYRDNFRLGPSLATAWRRLDDLTLEVELREGVRFHDGSLMTADDVAFTFGPERMTDPASKGHASSRAYFGTLDRVEVAGPLRVLIRSKAPDPVLPLRFAGWTSQVLSRRAFLAAGDWDRFARAPVATGPYRLAELRMGERIRLEAFDGYWGGRPGFASITFIAVPELAARLAGLYSGEYDIVTELGPDHFAAVTARPDLEVVGGPIANPRVLKFDTNHPLLRNADIRRALGLAIDRQAIVDALWGGRVAIPNGHQLPYYGDLHIADFPAPPHDPGRARQLLRAAGYRGEPIPYRTLAGYYAAQLATAQVLKSMWEAVGFTIDLGVRENFGQILAERPSFGIRDGTDPMLYPDPVSSIWRAYGPGSRTPGQPPVWQNARFDALGATLTTSLDTAARRRAFREMLEIYAWEDPPGVVLHTLGMFYAKRRDVRWAPYPAAYMDFRPANAGAA